MELNEYSLVCKPCVTEAGCTSQVYMPLGAWADSWEGGKYSEKLAKYVAYGCWNCRISSRKIEMTIAYHLRAPE